MPGTLLDASSLSVEYLCVHEVLGWGWMQVYAQNSLTVCFLCRNPEGNFEQYFNVLVFWVYLTPEVQCGTFNQLLHHVSLNNRWLGVVLSAFDPRTLESFEVMYVCPFPKWHSCCPSYMGNPCRAQCDSQVACARPHSLFRPPLPLA